MPWGNLRRIASPCDAQALNPGFTDALDFIEAHHNRTALAQGMHPSIFVAEFGVAQVQRGRGPVLVCGTLKAV